MEQHGDPDVIYDWPEEKRHRALTYLYARGLRDGRLTEGKADSDGERIDSMFGIRR